MNIVDIVILVIAAISVIYGIYRGFVASILSTVSVLLALLAASLFGPVLAASLSGNSGIVDTISPKLSSQVHLDNAQITVDNVWDYVRDIELPQNVKDAITTNLKELGSGYVGEELLKNMDHSVARVLISAISYVVCFVIASILLSVLISLIRHLFRLPILKHADGLAGGVLGLLRACIILYVLFLIVPVINGLVPIDGVKDALAESKLASIFQNDGYFARVIGGIF